jgi:hypothetical protein
MKPWLGRTLTAIAVALLLILVGWTCFVARQGSPPNPLPSPNGYDDFLHAASILQGDPGTFSTATIGELRKLLAENGESLRLLRLGLSRRCSVPTASGLTNFNGLVGDLPLLKSLSHLLMAEGRLAELEERWPAAAASYADAMALGNETGRGGFLFNYLVGLSFEWKSELTLYPLVGKLSDGERVQIIKRLARIDREQVSWDEVLKNEKLLSRHETHGNPVPMAIAWLQARKGRKAGAEKLDRVLATLRLIELELGLRQYRSEHGRPPSQLQELVPRQIAQVPIDPFSGKPMLYRAQGGTNWLVYSVGVDGVDDGGRPVGRSVSGRVTKGDLFFDSPW